EGVNATNLGYSGELAIPVVGHQPVEGFAQSRLGRAVAANHGDKVAGIDGEINITKRIFGGARVAEGNIAQGNCRSVGHLVVNFLIGVVLGFTEEKDGQSGHNDDGDDRNPDETVAVSFEECCWEGANVDVPAFNECEEECSDGKQHDRTDEQTRVWCSAGEWFAWYTRPHPHQRCNLAVECWDQP